MAGTQMEKNIGYEMDTGLEEGFCGISQCGIIAYMRGLLAALEYSILKRHTTWAFKADKNRTHTHTSAKEEKNKNAHTHTHTPTH